LRRLFVGPRRSVSIQEVSANNSDGPLETTVAARKGGARPLVVMVQRGVRPPVVSEAGPQLLAENLRERSLLELQLGRSKDAAQIGMSDHDG
jgi:hypothetical protein